MRADPSNHGDDAAQPGADEKDDRNQEILPCLVQRASLPRSKINADRLHSVADVPDTHCARVRIAVNIPKCLNLHRAGKRGQDVGDWVEKIVDREKPDDRQQADFDREHDMTPIEYAVELDTGAKLIRDDNAGTERGNREKVPDRAAEISGEKMMTHEDEISSQRIRENSSSNEIRVRVLKPAGECQRDHDCGCI